MKKCIYCGNKNIGGVGLVRGLVGGGGRLVVKFGIGVMLGSGCKERIEVVVLCT